MKTLALTLVAAFSVGSALAQDAAIDWRTIATEFSLDSIPSDRLYADCIAQTAIQTNPDQTIKYSQILPTNFLTFLKNTD